MYLYLIDGIFPKYDSYWMERCRNYGVLCFHCSSVHLLDNVLEEEELILTVCTLYCIKFLCISTCKYCATVPWFVFKCA